jgi:predicted TIM-barrel fold metal-dependent hydrolase
MPRPSSRLDLFLALLLMGIAAAPLAAQEVAEQVDDDEPHMDFETYEPRSTLVVPEHPVTRAKYPFVDVHSHQWGMPTQDLPALLAEMDAMNMGAMVNLSGRLRDSEEHLHASIANARENAPGRVLVFTNVDFEGFGEPGWGAAKAAQITADVAAGAAGLKIYKNLGLTAVDGHGERIPVDDPRLAPLWDACGAAGVPVLIHTGEPISFWHDKDEHNERWLELKQKPERYRDPETYPSWEQVMDETWAMFGNHPDTTFISAHMSWMANDLGQLGERLEAHTNVVTEIGAVLYELGRQPRFAREWFIQWQDRVMFGKDLYAVDEFPVYFRVLETDDEYFDYYRKRHAFWKMYGLDLPDVVLKKLYYGNALRVLPGLDSSLYPPIEDGGEILLPPARHQDG